MRSRWFVALSLALAVPLLAVASAALAPPKPMVPATVSIDQFLQTEVTGTYDPNGAFVTARVVDAAGLCLIENGTPDCTVTYPNYRFTFNCVPGGVPVLVQVTADDCADPYTAAEEKTF